MEKYQEIEHSLITTYRSKIYSPFVKGLRNYEMIQENDKIAVCMSGGKDSFVLAKCMQEFQKHGPIKFELEFLVMDPGYTEKNRNMIIENAKLMNIPITMFETNIFEAVHDIKQSPCYLCARMRRGCLYSRAQALGCNKIALGHHFDDVIETILMSTLYGGEFRTMMPKLHSDNFEGMELIRPLYLVREEDIIHFKNYNNLTFLNCACKFTEELSGENGKETTSKRKEIKELIKELRKKSSYIEMNIFKSVENVNLETIISYRSKNGNHHFLDDYNNKKGE